MNKTQELIKISKELERVLPDGFLLMFAENNKTGICTIIKDPPTASPIFLFMTRAIKTFMNTQSKYHWEKYISEFKVKEEKNETGTNRLDDKNDWYLPEGK